MGELFMKLVRGFVACVAVAAFAIGAGAVESQCEKGKCCESTKTVSVDGSKCEKSECCASTKTVSATDSCPDGGCPITKAMDKLPKMVYAVGDETTCCSKSAAALAEKHEKPISFVVGEKKFDNEQTAFVSLVEQTESFVTKFVTPSKCEKSGTTTVAGKACACPVEAGQTADAVKAAVGKVHFTYLVGEKECHCPNEAKSLASKAGEKTVFVVAGEKTSCEMTARLNLARTKYKAAVKAIVSAENKADKSNES